MTRKPFTVLVCGGRNYYNYANVRTILDGYAHDHGPIILVQGGAPGADQMARNWAFKQNEQYLNCMINMPADWNGLGKAAGPIRNQKMLDEHRPDIVLAFPGGRGTADMVAKARAAGVDVVEIED